MKVLHMAAFLLLAIGGLNWLLVAFGWNVVEMLLGMGTMATKAVYILVGVSAAYTLATEWSHKMSM